MWIINSPRPGSTLTRSQFSDRWLFAVGCAGALSLVSTLHGQRLLIDFGTDTSYRGISVSNPDLNGNHWNSVVPGVPVANLIDTSGTATTIDLAFSTSAGTDSYNGPAGPTDDGVLVSLPDTDINVTALGDLGITNAVFDYAAGSPGAVRFQLQQLNPAKRYDLTFFGSHKYNVDNVTRYSVYPDHTYSTASASVDLTVGVGSSHNRDTVAVLTNLTPQVGDTLFVEFVGANGNLGYLNAMEIAIRSASNSPPLASAGAFAVPEGGTIVINARTLATDPDGDVVRLMSVGDTSPVAYGTASISGDGTTLTYTNTSGAPSSVDLFSYTVGDGNGAFATNSISIRIDPANGPTLLSATTDGTSAHLVYAAVPGPDYALEWAPSVAAPIDWQEVQVQAADPGGVLRFTNLLAVPPTHSFYRVRTVITMPARGASLPYLAYEAEDGSYGNGALLRGPSFDEAVTASEASGRQFVELDQPGEYVEWPVRRTARGMVLRFTMPDAPTGGGTTGTLGLYVNGSRVASLPLTSRWAWQYFPNSGDMDPSNDPTVNPRPRMRFDDHRHLFPANLNPGDVVRVQKDAQDTSIYGIDLIELEPVPPGIPAPANSLAVTDYGAVPNDGGNDLNAFNACEADARAQGRTVYIPPGRFDLSQRWLLHSVKVQGAGVWETELHFTSPSNCGIRGESVSGHTTELRDFHLTTELTIRNDSEHGLSGYFGQNSVISNLWSTHFNTGGWIAEYTSGMHLITDGLVVSGCRLRNTYADGLNFAKGSRNCVVENTHCRNNGDDALATWPSDASVVPETMNNTFRFNTVENTWRAAGLGIFGGRGHVAHDCVFSDISGQAGIRFNTVFPGHPFSASAEIVVSNMTVVRTTGIDLWGNKLGAVAFQTQISPVRYIRLSHVEITDSRHHGFFYQASNGQAIDNVFVHTATVSSSGEYGIYVRNGAGGWSENSFVTVTNSGSGAVWDFSAAFDLRKIEGNVGW
jgi:hypothetical protein